MRAGAGRRSRFRRKVPEGSGEFRCKMESVPEASSGRFRRVPAYAGVGSKRCWKVPEDSGEFRCVPEAGSVPEASSGRFRTILGTILGGSRVCWRRFSR